MMRWLILLLVGAVVPLSWAETGGDLFRSTPGLGEQEEFLPVDQAFRLSAQLDADTISVNWQIHPGYYLYRHRLKFTAAQAELGEPHMPGGKHKQDEYFGDVEVYYQQLDVTIPVRSPTDSYAITVEFQGCAEAGLCYPPTRRVLQLTRGNAAMVLPQVTPAAAPGGGGGNSAETEGGRLTQTLESGSPMTILLLFFLAGIGLAFTPCVLPMVPILSSIIVGRKELPSRWSAFALSLTYVLGMAVTYAILGMLVGYFGAQFNLQAKLQSAPVLIVFSLIFVALSLSMFGLYELQLPEPVRDRLNRLGDRSAGGEYLGVAAMGVVSSLVVSPCVSAPLAGALVYISATGDALLGGLALLALGLGMGMPLLLIGSSGGHLLPRAGIWMNTVKVVFGVMLLGVAVWLLERIMPAAVTMLLWSALALGLGAWLAIPALSRQLGVGMRVLGAGCLLYAAALVAGFLNGIDDPLQPLQFLVRQGDTGQRTEFTRVGDLSAWKLKLQSAREQGRPLMFDFYADWCISCKVMEKNVFSQPDVQALMAEFDLVQIDLTDNTKNQQMVLEQFGLFGPPSILFFDGRGEEIRPFRIQGEVNHEQFMAILRGVLARSAIAVAPSP